MTKDIYHIFDGKTILLTGGTGSFGRAFCNLLLNESNCKKILIYSRDEMKQWQMSQEYSAHQSRLRFFIGDVRDKERLYRAVKGVDFVVHAAALKIVPTAEYNPFECVKTNILGAMNVIDACLDNDVSHCVALSTDKASSPINLYGGTKLVSDKLFIDGNNYSGKRGTRFSVVRYGNVMGSRGSVIPFFLNLDPHKPLPITSVEMTRFMLSLNDGVELVLKAFNQMAGGEIFVKKIPSMNILEIAKAVRPNLEYEIVGIRPGEKLHEEMISVSDARFTYEFDDHYRILPNSKEIDTKMAVDTFVKVDDNFSYSSNTNRSWMSSTELKNWIENNFDKLGLF